MNKATLSNLKELKQSLSQIKVTHPWEAHFSDRYGKVYFFNPETKESRWEPPEPQSHENAESVSSPSMHWGDTSSNGDDASQGAHSTSTSSRTGGGRIEDHLIKRGEEYMQKREELRLKKEQETQSEMTGKPQLSKLAAKLPNRGETDIAERTNLMLKAKKEKEENMRRELEEKEKQEITANPIITKRSQKLHRNVDDMISWDKNRRAKIEARQQELEEQQIQEMTAAPVLPTSKFTEKLLRNRKNRSSDDVPVRFLDIYVL